MRKLVAFGLFMFSTMAIAGGSEDPNSPFAGSEVPFDAVPKLRHMVEVVWFTVPDPQEVCEKEEGKKYSFRISACALRRNENRRCIVITGQRPTMGDLGHEIRHCFQGSWHSKDIASDPRATPR